ncbi:MAG: nucleotidyltransferase family protein [Candidatus Polarisedimenticolaceae bacterium]|nr:nucleotidyltransferase family protein [Candidatus Polarisedimenticolaceae bacterium]
MITGILLAAGQSLRFGRDKRLEPFASGTPIAIQSLRNLRPVVDRTVVVVASSRDPLVKLLQSEECNVLVCSEAERGMGWTLAHAVRENRDTEGWLIALADMPYIKPESYQAVAGSLRQGALISRPSYQQQSGHPVGFSKNIYQELSRLTGDQGARQFLGRYEGQIDYLVCDDPGVLVDIDKPQDIVNDQPLPR